MSPAHDDTVRAILYFLGQGQTPQRILVENPDIEEDDIRAAAMEGLRALEDERAAVAAAAPRVESRAERIARVRLKHPNAFMPWSEPEDTDLQAEFANGASIAALSRAFGRPAGAIRMRLEKLGVDPRRSKVS